MIDLSNQLEEFVEYSKFEALKGGDKEDIKKSATYRRLEEEYENLEELLDKIFETTTIENFIEEKLEREWDELRTHHITVEPVKYVGDSLCFRISLLEDDCYPRFISKHGREKLHEMAEKVINKKPYNEVEVYEEERKRFERNNPKYSAQRTAQTGAVSSRYNSVSPQRRLWNRFNDEDR